jgi:hypothetical protein
MSAASAVKRSDPSIAVVVLEKGEFVAYNACALPYYISNVHARSSPTPGYHL